MYDLDVSEIPVNGTWFQLIANGTTSVNTGPNGLQKLDMVLAAAEANNVTIILSLTNNWNPLPLIDNSTAVSSEEVFRRDVTVGTNNSLPRNSLSNDFGTITAFTEMIARVLTLTCFCLFSVLIRRHGRVRA